MTDQQLEANAETPMDFTGHLAERLQLAPETVAEQLEVWLLHYCRPQRTLPNEVPALDEAGDQRLHLTVG